MTRRTVDVPTEHLETMAAAQAADGVPVATRLRAMVQVWASDAAVRTLVDEAAEQLWAEAQSRRRAPLEAFNAKHGAAPGA